jgi:hypothetical protein
MKKILALLVLFGLGYTGYMYSNYQSFKSKIINETKRVITVKA